MAATKVAVVTGASGGVGRAVARTMADRGYDVGVIARGRAGLEATTDEIEIRGARALAVDADVADAQAVDAAAAAVEGQLGPIDVWINNAMTTVFGRIDDVDADEIRRATEVTYLGQVHGAKSALARMKPRDRGTIVFVGSALAYRGIPLQSAYCAAKFAARGFYESLRTELIAEGSGVKTTIVHLPAVNAPQFGWCRAKVDRHPMPVPPIYQPEVCAEKIADAAENPPRQRIVGAWNRLVVALAQAMPGVGDHYMGRTGVDSQLTDQPIDPSRPDDLFGPVDDDCDFGAHGVFDHLTGGATDPDWLRTLPDQFRAFLAAARGRVAEVREQRLG